MFLDPLIACTLSFQYQLEYRKKVRLLKVKMLNGALKSLMVDDSQTVGPMMALICAKIGLTNYDEYSLEIPPDESEVDNGTLPNKGTMKGKDKTLTMKKGTLGRNKDEKFDPKIEELKQTLKTEDGGECMILFLKNMVLADF